MALDTKAKLAASIGATLPLVWPSLIASSGGISDEGAPYGVATYATPTSLTLEISKTQGSKIRTYWRHLPYDQYDTVGPILEASPGVDSGTLTVSSLPESACILFNLIRDDGTSLSRPYSFVATTIKADTLAGALGRKWALIPSLTQTCGQLFTQEAPETLMGKKLALPWTICCYEHASFDFTFEGLYYETTTVEFTVYALGQQQIEDALKTIHTHIDWQGLPFENPNETKVIKVDPQDYSTASTFVRHRTGKVVWHGKISYQVTLEKQHPAWPKYLL